MELMLITLPPWRIIRRPASWVHRKVPSRITRSTCRQSARESASGRERCEAATLLTSTSIRP